MLIKKGYLFLQNNFHDSLLFLQILKFCGVGILNTIVGYGVFFILVNYLYYLIALLIAHIIGVTNSFIWNKLWVFKSKKISIYEYIKFNVIYGLVLIVNTVALIICVDIIHVDPKFAQLLLLPVITVVSFFGQRLWTFNKTKYST